MRRVATVAMLGFLIFGVAYAAAAVKPKAGAYSGSTSQTGGSVNFRVGSSGTVVNAFGGELISTCTKGSASQEIHIHVNPTPDMQIRKGAFGFHGKFTIDNGTKVIAEGMGSLSAKFTSKSKVSGSFDYPWNFDARAGSFAGYHCDTGKVTFNATAH